MSDPALLDLLPDMAFELDPKGVCLSFHNPPKPMEKWPKWTRGKHIREVFPLDVSKLILDRSARVLLEGGVETFEYELPTPNTSSWYEGRMVRSQRGTVTFVRHISEQAHTGQQIRELETRFRVMADYAPVMIWMAGVDSECYFFNEGWLHFTGRTIEQELGVGWVEGVHFEDFQRCMHTYMEHFVEGQSFVMEYRLRRADGEYRWIYDQGVPRFQEDGTMIGFIGSCIDITEQKEFQNTLTRINGELEHVNSELQQFAYAASHDLRAPLRAIDSLSQWLIEDLKDVLVGERQEHMKLLRGRVKRMDHLLTDILDYARAGKDLENVELVDTKALIKEVIDLLNIPAGFTINITHPMPILTTTPLSLKRVFMNLIGNAIKHHDRTNGCITISAQDAKNTAFFNFIVADDGPGIPSKFHDKIFQMFQTLKPRDSVEGSGIGLSLVKKLVKQAGGTITLESKDRGSTFSFTWPKNMPRVKTGKK